MKRIVWVAVIGAIVMMVLFYQFGYQIGPDPFSHEVYNRNWTSANNATYVELLEANSKEWGLGHRLEAYLSLDREYSWYIDQGDTGIHSNNNCGPSAVAMAIKWYRYDSELSADWARFYRRPWGGWWYSEDISKTLDKFKIPNDQVAVSKVSHLVNLLQQEKLLIVCNNMGVIPMAAASSSGATSSRVNRFYGFSGGHFLVVSGFVQVDDTLYFQVNDPNSWGQLNGDGTPKGRNRYYEAKS